MWILRRMFNLAYDDRQQLPSKMKVAKEITLVKSMAKLEKNITCTFQFLRKPISKMFVFLIKTCQKMNMLLKNRANMTNLRPTFFASDWYA